jgi:hypothetical protein
MHAPARSATLATACIVCASPSQVDAAEELAQSTAGQLEVRAAADGARRRAAHAAADAKRFLAMEEVARKDCHGVEGLRPESGAERRERMALERKKLAHVMWHKLVR